MVLGPDRGLSPPAVAIEQQQGHVGDAVSGGEVSARGAFHVGNQILQLALFKPPHGVTCFALEGHAGGASLIVYLDDRGNPITDPRKIVLCDRRGHVLDQIPDTCGHHGREHTPSSATWSGRCVQFDRHRLPGQQRSCSSRVWIDPLISSFDVSSSAPTSDQHLTLRTLRSSVPRSQRAAGALFGHSVPTSRASRFKKLSASLNLSRSRRV